MILGHSIDSTIQLRLPWNIDSTEVFHLGVSIHDTFNSITEFILPSLIILPNNSVLSNFIDNLQQSKTDPIVELLNSDNQNIVGQLIQSISEYLNQINDQTIQKAIAGTNDFEEYLQSLYFLDGQDDLTSMTTTSLNNELYQRDCSISSPSNHSIELKNKHARVRDYLMILLSNFSLITLNDLIFQSSILFQLTRTSNELSRQTAVVNLLHQSILLFSSYVDFRIESVFTSF